MAAVVILDNEDATLWYHAGGKTIHHYVKRFIHGEPLRTVLEQGAVAMAKYRAIRWLSDDRNNGALTPEDEKWGREVWFPTALKAGWKHWAIVQPAKVVGQLNMKRFKETYAQAGINAQMFSDPDEAMTWLLSQ
jgi:hypothetical protein